MQVRTRCDDCKGTGLVNISPEKGTADVCIFCNGRGWLDRVHTDFTGREEVSGVTTVNNRNSGTTMTYEEFARTLGHAPVPLENAD